MDEVPAYTRDDYLTTTKPFEYLYAHKENKFEMKQLLGRMSAQAQTVGIRNLAALFKAYMETVSGTVTPGYNKTDFSGQEMELDCGGWSASDTGIYGTDNMGFSIVMGNRHFVFATDMGAVSSRALHYIQQAHFLVVEANYDLEMLLNGRYPDYLKARIRTPYGHMDNSNTAALLAKVAGHGLKYVWLCHLSRDNNMPEKALATVRQGLENAGFTVGSDAETTKDRDADLILTALPRFDATRLYVLR